MLDIVNAIDELARKVYDYAISKGVVVDADGFWQTKLTGDEDKETQALYLNEIQPLKKLYVELLHTANKLHLAAH